MFDINNSYHSWNDRVAKREKCRALANCNTRLNASWQLIRLRLIPFIFISQKNFDIERIWRKRPYVLSFKLDGCREKGGAIQENSVARPSFFLTSFSDWKPSLSLRYVYIDCARATRTLRVPRARQIVETNAAAKASLVV